MQALEAKGTVDFELAGHTATRPPEVCQGSTESDKLPGIN